MNLSANLVMSRSVVSVRPEDDLATAFKKMKDHEVRHLPVIDKDQKLVGVLSNRDLAEFSTEALVKDYMSAPAVTAAIDTSLGEITQKMIDKKISAVVIVKNDHVIGILTTHDLLMVLRLFLKGPTQPQENAFIWKFTTSIGDVMHGLTHAGTFSTQ